MVKPDHLCVGVQRLLKQIIITISPKQIFKTPVTLTCFLYDQLEITVDINLRPMEAAFIGIERNMTHIQNPLTFMQGGEFFCILIKDP